MARVTVEDCVERVPNRFELVMMAGQRARDIAAGATLTIDRDRDKNPVVALREIADETVELEVLRNSLIKGHQRVAEQDEPEEEIVELMAGENAWADQGAGASAGFGDEDADGIVEAGESGEPNFGDGDLPAGDLADEESV